MNANSWWDCLFGALKFLRAFIFSFTFHHSNRPLKLPPHLITGNNYIKQASVQASQASSEQPFS